MSGPCPQPPAAPFDGTVRTDLVVLKNARIDGDLAVGGKITQHGLSVSPEIDITLSKAQPIFVVPEGTRRDFSSHTFEVVERNLTGSIDIDTPFDAAPLGTIANPPGIINLDVLRFQIINTPRVAPWFFTQLPESPTGRYEDDAPGDVALFCGLPEIFAPGAGSAADRQPPGRNTISQIDITINRPTTILSMDLLLRYSTEPSYDFALIRFNNTTIFSAAGAGESAETPFLAHTRKILMQTGDTLSIVFTKDPAFYSGLDQIYFILRNLQYVTRIPLPTIFNVIRKGVVVRNFGGALSLNRNDLEDPQTVRVPFRYLGGDIIELLSSTVYGEFAVHYVASR